MVKSKAPALEGWAQTRNLAKLPEGLVRSILGYAGESIVIGRALACGYNLFFKAWRDSKYDAVLDAKGELFRIEIKQTGDGKNISCTSGGRSGEQISRSASSRETVLTPDESDFLIGVHTFTGKCWIVPTEVIHIRNRKTNTTSSLEDYLEKWKIFSEPPAGIRLEQIRKGFRSFSIAELRVIARKLGITQKPSLNYKIYSRGRSVMLKSKRDWYVLEIWNAIFSKI
ncbi:MAG: hypothetical protein Q7R42_03925 [Candidatus Planktophila sp.]|nr:hypothetical protein [Candidatus Planktophila sp.]